STMPDGDERNVMFANWACVRLLLVASLSATSAPYPRADLLVEAADLAKPESARFRILDVRPRASFADGHIPGAVWVDVDAWSKAFSAGQDASVWAKLIGAVGIDSDATVVIYDDNKSKDAARVWWILRYFGVKDVRLLNGGWSAWRARNGTIA